MAPPSMIMTDHIFLGIDYGDRRSGLAVSDASAMVASGFKTIQARSASAAARLIFSEFAGLAPVGIVVGYPVAPDGGEKGERCRAVDRFIRELKKLTDLPIYHQDERDTSSEAQDIVHAHGKPVGRKRTKGGVIDRIAAAIILQRWLDERGAN